MKGILTSLFLFVFISTISAFEARINITAFPSTATIYLNEKKIGVGTALIVLEKAEIIEIKVENIGYKTTSKTIHYVRGAKGGNEYDRGINNFPIILEKDESYVNNVSIASSNEDIKEISFTSDSINSYISFSPNNKYSQSEAWKIVNKIVGYYFDDLESLKNDTAYIQSSWQVKIVGSKKIRTRIIVRTDMLNPLTYKIKVQSEYSSDINANTKENDKYREWDRILKKYKNIFFDLNKGLGKATK